MTPLFLGALIGVNILVINAFLAKVHVMPFLFSNKINAGWMGVLLIALVALYYNKNKREAILAKYSQESVKRRIRGNIIVALYVAISFLSIYAVAFFKPGKL